MDVPDKHHKTELATWHLINLVGIALELAELDPTNAHWYEGYRDAIVSLIGEGTGQPINLVRRDLEAKIREFQMESQIEELFGDEDGLSGFDC